MSETTANEATELADPWVLRYERYEPGEEGLREALCTVGNGYFATRGAAPESVADEVHGPGTYAAGIFNRLTTEIAGEEVANESIVNLPNWLSLTFRIDEGPWFAVDDVEVVAYEQTLDLRRAVLTRRLRFRDDAGRTTTCTQRRFVSMDQRHVGALETTIVAEDWSGRLEVRSLVDGRVDNTLVERYRQLAGQHLDVVATACPAEDAVLLVVETNQSHIRIAVGARTRVHRDGAPVEARRRVVDEPDRIGHAVTVDLTPEQQVTVEKIAVLYTGRDPAISEPGVEVSRWLPRLGSFEELLEGHVVAWGQLWQRFRFEAAHDTELMGILRLHLLHLLQTVSPNTIDLDVGVPARGLHGEAYRGHILWDELFVFPILNLRLPALTRSLLRYRYRRLPEARAAARSAGYAGAMFPWQSGSDGREESQELHLNPAAGRWVPDRTDRQRHVGIAIAYNVWQYYEASGDEEFLQDFGAELLLEIARFWASIARYDRGRDRFVICGVMGPDEFHTGYPDAEEEGIDNNAYTNVMAVWVLLRAMDTLAALPELVRREIQERLGIDAAQLERWREITQRMFVPFHGDGVISQFEGYADLAELDWEHYRAEYGDIHRLDRILGAEDDTPNRYQASKQADALMLFYLLSADELREILRRLGYDLPPEAILRTIDYYLARTSHGSTLSSMVHAWVTARSDRARALAFYEQTLAADIADVQGGTTPEGIHLAAMAGSVDLLQRCFAGVETRHGRLLFNPHWPEELGTLSFDLTYRGQPLTVSVSGEHVEVSAGRGGDRPIEVGRLDETAVLHPDSSIAFPLGGPARGAAHGRTPTSS